MLGYPLRDHTLQRRDNRSLWRFKRKKPGHL
jgi:hypothetical protein